jgi:hypothetical protein
MRYCTLVLFSLLFFGSCSIYHRVKSNRVVTQAQLDTTDYYEELPFETTYGLPLFTVRVGDDPTPRRFFFDTGGYTVLSRALIAATPGTRPVSRIAVKDGSSITRQVRIHRLDRLRVGALDFSGVGFAEISFTEAVPFTCMAIDGTLGPNIMKEGIWYFDNDRRRLVMTDDLARIAGIEGAIRVPIKTNNINKPRIPFVIDGAAAELTFDTGASGHCALMAPFGERVLAQGPTLEKQGQRVRTGHAERAEPEYLGRIPRVDISGLVLEDEVFSPRASGSSHILSVRVFRRYNVAFDLAHDAVYFLPRRRPEPPPNWNSFGFGLDWQDGQVVVGYLYTGSPADRAGVRVGDPVLRINGQERQFADYCTFLNEFELTTEPTIELELRQDGAVRTLRLQREELWQNAAFR